MSWEEHIIPSVEWLRVKVVKENEGLIILLDGTDEQKAAFDRYLQKVIKEAEERGRAEEGLERDMDEL